MIGLADGEFENGMAERGFALGQQFPADAAPLIIGVDAEGRNPANALKGMRVADDQPDHFTVGHNFQPHLSRRNERGEDFKVAPRIHAEARFFKRVSGEQIAEGSCGDGE